jgi:hypothetical protein
MKKEFISLIAIGSIKEIVPLEWLANPTVVKNFKEWWMCIDYMISTNIFLRTPWAISH